jgi:hypothetical protein
LDVVDISKRCSLLADFYSGINYSNPLRDLASGQLCRTGDSSSGNSTPIRHYRRATSAEGHCCSQSLPRNFSHAPFEEGGIATFWLLINQLKVEEAKQFCVRFTMPSPTPLSGERRSGVDHDAKVLAKNRSQLRQLWNDPASGADRGGSVGSPTARRAILMDGEESTASPMTSRP